MAKKFFYVCAGLFLLALAYHLGARSAGAQIAGSPVGGISNGYAWAAQGGRIYGVRLNDHTGVDGLPGSLALPKPGNVVGLDLAVTELPSPVIGAAWVVYDDGSVYQYSLANTAGAWVQVSNLFGALAVEVKSTTWGQVKDRYRK